MIVYGIDSVAHERQWIRGVWKSVIGLCVGVEDFKKFESSYKEKVREILKNNGFHPQRSVYSSYSINRLTRNPLLATKIFEEIFNSLKDDIKTFHFIISMYPKMPEIFIFGRRRMSFLSPKDFMERHLIRSYPHVCAWKILSLPNTKVFVDSFDGYLTSAWEDIDTNQNMEILFHGDESNTLISMADIVLRVTDKRLKENFKFLGRREIKEIFPELENKLEVSFLGKSVLPKVTPLVNITMPIYKKVKHPIVFILGPETEYLDSSFIKYSPKGDSLFEFCHIIDGCIKMFNKERLCV